MFLVVTHKYGALSHHLDVVPFPSNFSLPSAGEDLGRPREVLDVFKTDIVDLTCFIFHVQGYGAYPLGVFDPPDAIYLCIFPLI